MTITNQTNKTIQAGNGVTQTFNFAFPIFQASDLKVYKYLTSSTETTHTPLTITTDYTVVISSTTEGGSVTFVVTPLATETIAIVRDLAYTQTTDIDLNGNFPEVDVENALDKNDMLAIQLKEQVDRALTISQFSNTTIGDIETPEDRRALIFSDNGDGTFDIVNSEYDPDEQVANATAQADIATAQAVIATTQTGLSSGYATQSAGYRDEAEGYRDEAQAAAASINGDPLWSATKTFAKGDITTVIVSDIPYKYYNLTGTNTATSPQSDTTNWALWSDKDRAKKDGSDMTLSDLAATAIANIQKLLTLNYAAGVSILSSLPYTVTANGQILIITTTNTDSNGNVTVFVNGVLAFYKYDNDSATNNHIVNISNWIKVGVGDVVTYSQTGGINLATLAFYPYRSL